MTKRKKKDFLKEFLIVRDELFAFVYSMIPSYNKAEDVFQDASLVLWERFESYAPGTNFKAWARRIIYNKIRNEWQKAKKEELWSPEVFDALNCAFDEISDTETDWKAALRACLDKLNQNARELIHLKYYDCRTYKEIAEIVDRSAKGTRVVLCRIREKLADCIHQQVGVGE